MAEFEGRHARLKAEQSAAMARFDRRHAIIEAFGVRFTTFGAHWRAGIRTLLSDGANFRRVIYPYLYTDTCAGHATISTGTLPNTHGMVADEWWDRDGKREVDCTDDDDTSTIVYGSPLVAPAPAAARGAAPAAGRGAAQAAAAPAPMPGNSARPLLALTLADHLRQQRPGGRVVALSLKERAAINLVGHAGDAVLWFTCGTFVTSSAFASAPVPEVKQFIDASPVTSDAAFVWTLRDSATMYRNRDAGIGERPSAPRTGLFPHVLGTPAQFAFNWQRTPAADRYLARMATALIDAYRLGSERTRQTFWGSAFRPSTMWATSSGRTAAR